MDLKTIVKKILKLSPFALSKNHAYDLQTKKILKQVLKENSNCVDVGCHKGEIIEIMLTQAPKGVHFGFEPIPILYHNLRKKYSSNPNCIISSIAASNQVGESSFNYVVSNPSYSGLKKRAYDKKNEQDKKILVQTNKLDNVIPDDMVIDLIKIDVEGGEMLVLEGAKTLIEKHQPIILFEHGLGASDFYDYGPEKLFSFFEKLDYSIYTLNGFLSYEKSLSKSDLIDQFYQGLNYYFIAKSSL